MRRIRCDFDFYRFFQTRNLGENFFDLPLDFERQFFNFRFDDVFFIFNRMSEYPETIARNQKFNRFNASAFRRQYADAVLTHRQNCDASFQRIEQIFTDVFRSGQILVDDHILVEDPTLVDRRLDDITNQILEYDLMELSRRLQEGRDDCTAFLVLYAYTRRAIQVNNLTNCIVKMIETSVEKALELDRAARNAANPVKGPLYGLPFSVKENFRSDTHSPTLGLAKNIQEGNSQITAEDSSALVRWLEEQGAIPFCYTNVPQGIVSYVTSNPLYGTTKNPWDFSRTPGGSSGGEAALVAAGGAAFGIGNDLAGSLRIPAAFCGLVSLKPSRKSLIDKGMMPGNEPPPSTRTHAENAPNPPTGCSFVPGFFTKRVAEQEWLLRHVFTPTANRSYIDVAQHTVRREEMVLDFHQLGPTDDTFYSIAPNREQLVIGLCTFSGFAPVSTANLRAVTETRLRLETYYRVSIVEFSIGDVFRELAISETDLAKLVFQNVLPDGGEYVSSQFANEPSDNYLSTFINIINWIQYKVVSWLVRLAMPVMKWNDMSSGTLADALTSREDVRQITERVRTAWNSYWQRKRMAAMICPSFITPAQPFNIPEKAAVGTFVTGLFNMLDAPAGIVPVKRVQNGEDQPSANLPNDRTVKMYHEAARNATDLPMSVQVVAENGREDTCLMVMKMIERVYAEQVQCLKWRVPQPEQEGDSLAHFTREVLQPEGQPEVQNAPEAEVREEQPAEAAGL